MESTEPESLDDSKNLETTSVVVEDMVTKYDDSEAAENEEDQSGGEQVYGYLYRSAGSEDATIYVDSRGFNLNGQSLIVTQNDDGNEIIVLVGEDPDGQPLDQTFAHSVLQSDEVSFEDGLKEHGTLVVDEHSQGLEFIKSSEEASEEHEERHMYIENSGEILNISNENVGSPVDIESPLWSVSNSGHLKNDGTEMLFIPNPTVVLAPEETKHRKLMQLACIAHELQSADQKSSSSVMCDYIKDPETSVTEYEGPDDKVDQSDEEKNSADEEEKSLLSSERERCINFSSKPTKIASTVLSGSSGRVVDNTVSVIHSTSSEVQGSSLENQTKLGSPPDFSSEKNFQNSESELPSEMLYSNVTFHDNLEASPSAKQLEECSRESLEENSQSLIPEVTDERCSEQNLNLELNNNDSPLTFIDKTHNLDVDHLNTEDNVLEEAGPDMKIDEDSHANSTALVIEDENPKSHDSDSSASLMDCHLSKAIDLSERTSQEDNVPEDTVSDIDDDNISSTEHSVSVSENESSFLSSQYSMFNYKKRALRQSLEKTPALSSALRDDKPQVDSDPVDLSESNMKELKMDEAKFGKITRRNNSDFEPSPGENLESDLVIAETVEERNPCEAEPAEDDYVFREEEPADVRRFHTKELVSMDRASVRPNPDHKALAVPDAVHRKQSNDEVRVDKTVPVHSNSSPDSEGPSSVKKAVKKTRIRSPREDDYSSSEETPLMKTKKTYLSFKKMKKSMLENKMNTQEEKIVLYSDDIHDCDNDKEVTSRTHESRENSPSTHANTAELDESTLVSTVSVTRTYVNSVPKEKSLFRKKRLVKQSLRSHSLRARSLPSTLPLNNGNSEVSDSDSKKNSFDLNNSDNIPWGKMLLETSFDQCSLPNDTPSTSFASQYPKETSTPLLSPEQQRRKLNKAKRDFDRLLNSSPPIATKQPKIGKKFRMHPNVIKATKSRYSSSQFSRFPKSNSLPLSSSNSSPSKSSSGKRVQARGQKPKEAKIQYLYEGSPDAQLQPEQSSFPNKNELYSCSSCNFSSIYVDNLMEHLKYCSSRQPILDYEVNNMDKRQRIRGEEEIKDTVQNTLKKIKSDLRSGFMDDDPSVSQLGEDERDSDHVRKRKSLYRQYGYGDDDVVWVKFKDRFWPALVCSIEGLTAYVKLISYPKEVKGLKVKHENIRTFDNSKWNVLCLHEAQSLPHNDIFVKAVQSSERFMSKKFLGVRVTGKEFFSVRDEVDFATDSASSDSIVNEDSDSEMEMVSEPARKARYERLDLSKIFDHLIKGKADDYVLDIFNNRKHSQKHIIFFDKQRNEALKSKPWFGPFEDKKQRNELFSHFQNLFTNKIGKRTYFVHYICQVMIPEAIVQAISVVKGIPLKDAELLFESEDSMDLENEDPSVEDILKKYS